MSSQIRPNIVLVHGAWADGSSWSAVIEALQDDGYNVTAPQPDEVARLIEAAAASAELAGNAQPAARTA